MSAKKVIEQGACQPVMNLNARSRDDLRVRFDWSMQTLKEFVRYDNSPLFGEGGDIEVYSCKTTGRARLSRRLSLTWLGLLHSVRAEGLEGLT